MCISSRTIHAGVLLMLEPILAYTDTIQRVLCDDGSLQGWILKV